jgi:hypothetical protein
MRANMLPILEQYGVDLVLSGHSHSYERSYLLDGHYGPSSTLTAAMKKDAGSGRPAETGAYAKPSTGPAPHEGAVYVVAGSSGQTSGFGPGAPHPAMFVSLNNLGSMVLDLNGDRLDVAFLRENGSTPDTFTLVKGTVGGNLPPDVSLTSPANGSSFSAPASITLSANAVDEGSVTQVAFFNGATPLGSVTSPPYMLVWNSPPQGNHRLTARATDNGGATHISAPVFVSITAPTVPAAPSGLVVSSATANSVTLGWADNATNETGYQIERAQGGGSFGTLASLGINATSHVDPTVSPTTMYSYRVRAVNAVGPSGYSNTVSVTTPGVPPSPPSSLSATAVSTSQINLAWTDGSANETGFKIERSQYGTKFVQIAAVGANATTYANTGLANNRVYYYRVRATNLNGDSAYSNVASAKTPRR